MLDGNKLKFGDLLVEKGKECNSLFMFLTYVASRSNIKLLKIPSDIYIQSAPAWKPDYESFLDSRYVRDHGFYRPILNMNYADPDVIKIHNDKANPYLDIGKWLYNCSQWPISKPVDEWLNSEGAKRDYLKFKNACYLIGGRGCGKTAMMKDFFEYLENQNIGKWLYLRQKFNDVDATNAIKEFINKQYGTNSFGRAVPDDSLDALRYVCPTIEQIREEYMRTIVDIEEVRVIDRGEGNWDVRNMHLRVYIDNENPRHITFCFYDKPHHSKYNVKFKEGWPCNYDIALQCENQTSNNLCWQFCDQNISAMTKANAKYAKLADRLYRKRKEKNMTLLQKGNVIAQHRYGIGYSYGMSEPIWCEAYINENKDVEFIFEYVDAPFDDKAKITVIIERNIFEKEVLGKEVGNSSRYDHIINRVRDASFDNLRIENKSVTSNFFLAVTVGYTNWLLTHRGLRGKFIKVVDSNSSEWIYCITDYWLDTAYERCNKRTKANLHAFRKPKNIGMEAWATIVKRNSKEYIKGRYDIDESTLYYYEYDDGRIEIPFYEFVEDNTDCPLKADLITDRVNPDAMDVSKEMEMLQNCYTKRFSKAMEMFKKEEETKEMNNNILKGAYGSNLYMMRRGSEDLSYLGTVMGMSIDHVVGCELAGKIDFVADDEPVKKLQYFNREFIKNVVFNDPATIVEWKDGTKTVVQARDGEKFDPEKGLAMAIAKKAMGNKRDYYHVFKHYNKKAEKDAKKKDLKEIIKSLPDMLRFDNQAIDLEDFKVNSDNDLVTFRCSKADAERIKEFITRSNDSKDVHITPETIEEVKRYEEDK